MTTESNREAGKTSQASTLKDSDFFPPGSGWNKAKPEDRNERREPEQTEYQPLHHSSH